MDFDNLSDRREWLRRLQASAKGRARKANMPFTLPPEYAARLDKDQDGRCAVTGLRFNLDRFNDALVKHPFAPSIDRRLSSGGYTEDNVRLVCVAVNFGMGQWGEEVFLSLARAAVRLEAERTLSVAETPSGSDADTDWHTRQRERINAAEQVRSMLTGKEYDALTRHIAALKRALSLGPKGLKVAAEKAKKKRAEKPDLGETPT